MMRGLFGLMLVLSWSVGAGAAQVKYTWSGTVDAPLPGAPDPWAIGPTGQPFALSVIVDQGASDIHAGLPQAQFELLALEFAIAGVPASSTSFSGSSLDFIDGAFLGQEDRISVAFAVEFNGHTETIQSSVSLPADTFAFLLSGESPPVFGTASTSLVFGYWNNSYFNKTIAGVEVTSNVVPEPSTYVLASAGGIGLLFARRLRLRRIRLL